MENVESDRERTPRPLASLGNDSDFLDAILGEILQPQLHDAMAREREWGRRRGTPSAPPLEVDVLDYGVFAFPEVSPIRAAVAEPETAPQEEVPNGSGPEDCTTTERLLELINTLADNLNEPQPVSQELSCNSARTDDSSPTSASLLELATTLADDLNQPQPASQELSCDSARTDDSSPTSTRLLELVTTLADDLNQPLTTPQEGDLGAIAKLDDSASSTRLLELMTTLADTMTPLQPAPCEISRCDSWEFSSLRILTEPALASRSVSTCSSFDSLSRALHGLSANRASMCLPRSRVPSLPVRPRSASPTLPQPHATLDIDSTLTSNFTSSDDDDDDDADSHFAETLDEPRHLGSGGGSPGRQRMRTTLTDRVGASSTPTAAKPTPGWLRMSMRRVRPFRLEPPARPTSAPVAAVTDRPPQARPTSGPRPTRGQRRRISSSTSQRRAAAPELAWIRHPLSDDEENNSPSPVEPASSQRPHPALQESILNAYEMPRDCQSPLGQWPHGLSSVLASLGCTLGLFNISRFAILSVQFGANFFLQFLIMSALVGIPLFTFHVSLGQLLAAGTMDMWKISPIFQGVGIALLVTQALLGIYSIVGVSWMFIYFRDSFITKQDIYRWAEPFNAYRDDGLSMLYNSTPVRIEETVPDYFSGVVLQRNLSSPGSSPGNLKFQATFNLAVVWMLVFISLSKGLKSYGKVVYLFSLVPVFGMLLFCSKLLGFMPADPKFQFLFPETEWSEFFLNTKSWVAASTEAFYTWGLLGAAAMQVASHNRPKHFLHRDTAIVIIFTLSILALSAFLANSCTQILLAHGFVYMPSSFERMSTYAFLHPTKSPLPHAYAGTPVRWLPHNQYVVGESVWMPGTNPHQQSGYQALRLATELVPSTLALIGANNLSPFWSVLFYFVLILFGIAQQLAIWHCLITGIMAINIKKLKNWETTITFFTCACGFILGLPMATQFGIFVVYFLDYCVGGGWWVICLYFVELLAVFMVRGRPYSGETVVAALFSRAGSCMQNLMAPLLSFIWNVILPVLMMVVFITIFKNANFRELFRWNAPMFYEYWPSWARELGCLLQIVPLLTIPFIALIQSCRFLTDGPPDIFDRIQMLYRPEMGSAGSVLDFTAQTDLESNATITANIAVEDPPPKYTPPPSYTTATGARIAKLLRQSFRRSMRRITTALGSGEASEASARPRLPPPPDYSAVLVEMHQSRSADQSDSVIVNRTDHSTLTADDVATILRSSIRRNIRDNVVESSSSERLVDAAAPINEDSIVLENIHIDKSLELHRH